MRFIIDNLLLITVPGVCRPWALPTANDVALSGHFFHTLSLTLSPSP